MEFLTMFIIFLVDDFLALEDWSQKCQLRSHLSYPLKEKVSLSQEFRLISLLKDAFKIITKVLSHCLPHKLHLLVDDGHLAFVKN